MKPFAIALGLFLALPLAAAAQTRGDSNGNAGEDRDPVIVMASCGDLRAEIAATRPECQPARQVVVIEVSESAPALPSRTIRALPWLIGAYN